MNAFARARLLSGPMARGWEQFKAECDAEERRQERARRETEAAAVVAAIEEAKRQRAEAIAAAAALPPDPSRAPFLHQIKLAVCLGFEAKMSDIESPRRTRDIVRPRQVAMWLCRRLTSKSLPDIGRMFGGRDHTTILHAVRKVDELMASDPAFASKVQEVRQSLMPEGGTT